MADWKLTVVATVQGEPLTLQELLQVGRRSGKFKALIEDAVREKVVAQAARRAGLTVSTPELQQAADLFRRRAKLTKAGDTHRWLADHQMTVDDLEANLEQELLQQKLAAQGPPLRVVQFFAEHRTRYDRARLAHLVVAQESAAQELLSQIQEEELDFAALARQHSLDHESRPRGGSLGVVHRKSLSPAVESAVFNARKGQVVGPVKTDMGYHLIKVEEILLGQLDAGIADAIRQELFRSWLREQIQKAQVDVRL
jgi:parvulin-like peptidyl-prolyl isomerase